MSDIRKWIKIMESVPAIFPGQDPKHALIKQDATIMVNPSIGGGTARYMNSTPNGAMVDIKGIAKELSPDEFSLPGRDYEDGYQKGNDWFHMSVEPDTPGTSNERPEFRTGDMVKIADVYGSVIGPGMGVFVAYSTSGKECIISFDDKEILVPTANVAAVLEQNAKNNFDKMDNDGNLSPMSFGSKNVKVGEPAMDQRDEFSKWMSAVEEALENEGKVEVEESIPANECGCGAWNCNVCFPDEVMNPEQDMVGTGCPECGGMGCPACDGSQLEIEPEIDVDGLEVVDHNYDMEEDSYDDYIAAGGKIKHLPYKGSRKEKNQAGRSMSSSHIGGVRGAQGDMPGKGRLPSGNKPIVGEEEENFIEKPRSGKGVKLGNIVQSTRVVPVDGHNSPETYGGDNLAAQPRPARQVDDIEPELDEEIPQGANPEDYGKAGRHLQKYFDDGDLDEDPNMGYESGSMEPKDDMHKQEIADKIENIQNIGFSKDDRHYSREELMMYTLGEIKACYDRVMGNVSEARPTMTKSKHHLDDIEDILNPSQGELPATIDTDDSEVVGDEEPMKLPAASSDTTRQRVGSITPSGEMRNWLNRINPDVGAAEPEIPDTPENAVVVRTASDVPAVINNAIRASGIENPEWHHVRNLPGYSQRNVRGMGRQLFSMFTSTPLENIQTMANVQGQGPNTDAEMRSVAGWLRDNAEDLGEVQVSHGMAIPGYEPDVREYSINGVRFHVVRDPMGQYIYAYPDADARLQGSPENDILPDNSYSGGNMPRLRESLLKPTLFEQMKWDEEIDEAFIEESSLSKLIGKQKGGQNLVHWLHRKHKLSNEADLEPAPFSERLLWKEFKSHPDNFVIVSAQNGVAGIKPDKKFIENRTKEFARRGKTYNPGGDSTLPYQIVAFTDDGQQIDPELLRAPAEGEEDYRDPRDPTVMRARMGKHSGKDTQNPYNVFNLLADQIGSLRTVWTSGFENEKGGQKTGSVEREKMTKRAELKKGPGNMPPAEAVQKIFMRVKPVLKTLANQAILQINKRAQRYIEGGNYEAAQKISTTGQKLKQFLVSLDTNNAVNVDTSHTSKTKELSSAITKAIAQASGSEVGSDEYNDFASQAASGSMVQLRPVLDAIRDQLVGL